MRAVVATVRNLLKGVTLTRGSLGYDAGYQIGGLMTTTLVRVFSLEESLASQICALITRYLKFDVDSIGEWLALVR